MQVKRTSTRALDRAMTLMEIVVVLAVLMALIGVVLMNLNPDTLRITGIQGDNSARGIITQNTMTAIRNALFGDANSPGYWQDMGAEPDLWPRRLEWLYTAPTAAEVYGASPAPTAAQTQFLTTMTSHNPLSRLGWRGPYFNGNMIPLTLAGRTDVSSTSPQAILFAAKPTSIAYLAPADAWGQPILMVPPTTSLATWDRRLAPASGAGSDPRYVLSNCRLVSPGANRRFDSLGIVDYADVVANPAKQGDDIILWLRE